MEEGITGGQVSCGRLFETAVNSHCTKQPRASGIASVFVVPLNTVRFRRESLEPKNWLKSKTFKKNFSLFFFYLTIKIFIKIETLYVYICVLCVFV